MMGGELLVRGALGLSKESNIPPVIVGMTVGRATLLGAEARFERSEGVAPIATEQPDPVWSGSLAARITRDTRDRSVFPRRGARVQGSWAIGNSNGSAEGSFIQWSVAAESAVGREPA